MSEQKKTKRGLFGFFGKKKTVEESPEETITDEIVEDSVAEETVEEATDLISTETESVETIIEDLTKEPHVEITQEIAEELVEEATPETIIENVETPEPTTEPEIVEVAENIEEASQDTVQEQAAQKTGFFGRLKAGLSKTRSNFSEGLANIVLGSKQIDDELLEDIETQLLMADVGVDATRKIITELTQMSARKELKDADALMVRLQELLSNIIKPCAKPLVLDKKPYVILMVGINGVGKTTTIGKLAKKFQQEGKSVMLAAGDTFRAAAVEQLQVWGERNDIHVTAQHTGADSASVIFDSLQAAQARNVDVLIADTAGRLHTKSNLMDELSKVKRVMQKLDVEAPHEVMLVVDAGTGQNAINQAEHFHKAVGLTGISISKLDGTAKGGVIFALADKMQIPIRFIGVGEGIDDLREFDADDFIKALFTTHPVSENTELNETES